MTIKNNDLNATGAIGTVIDFSKYTKKPVGTKDIATAIFSELGEDKSKAVIEYVLRQVLDEMKIGLGLVESDQDISDLPMFNQIADIYEQAAGGCYFCSEDVDPNEDGFDNETELCLMCKLKLANFTQALGIPSDKVFKGLKARAQKTKTIFWK